MSLIEGDQLFYPLFSSSDIPIDLNVHNSMTDSPRFHQLKRMSTGINMMASPSQTVPSNLSSPVPTSYNNDNLFNLLTSGGIEKLDFPLNTSLLKGLQMTDDFLFQSGLIMNPNKQPAQASDGNAGADSQFPVIVSDTIVSDTFAPKANIGSDEPQPKNTNNKKRKLGGSPKSGNSSPTAGAHSPTQTPHMPGMTTPPAIPSPIEGQSLSPDEERNMKRQRRLVKNREAAQLFRQRQKAYIQDLEKRVGDLSGTNNELRARIELLNSENKLIKEQLLYLRNFIQQQALSLAFPTAGQKTPGSPDGANLPQSPVTLQSPGGTALGHALSGLPLAMPPNMSLPPALLAAANTFMAPGMFPHAAAMSLPSLPNLPMPMPHGLPVSMTQGSPSLPNTVPLSPMMHVPPVQQQQQQQGMQVPNNSASAPSPNPLTPPSQMTPHQPSHSHSSVIGSPIPLPSHNNPSHITVPQIKMEPHQIKLEPSSPNTCITVPDSDDKSSLVMMVNAAARSASPVQSR